MGISSAWSTGNRRVLAQLPTGGGKGRILAAAAARAASRGRRVVLMAHRIELVEQISANLYDEGITHGRIMPGASMGYDAVHVGMVQTIARRLDRLYAPDLLMIDEAHHISAGQYQSIISAWPNAHILGVSATPKRTDGKPLDSHFDVMVQGPSVADLIRDGFLADYDYYLPSPNFDARNIKTRMGEYDPKATMELIKRTQIVGSAVEHYKSMLNGRPAIAFCRGVEGAETTAQEFLAAGIPSAHVDGEMHLDLRKARLGGLADGTIKVLTAADVISEGVDIPAVAGAILLRPTTSLVLFLQQVGRALRPKPDGSRAIILDHVGNAKTHGFPADPRLWSLGGKMQAEISLRECPKCHRAFHAKTARETAEAECKRDKCPILEPMYEPKSAPAPIEVIPGTLERASDPWAWTRGCDVARATGEEYRTLLKLADTEDKLRQIARVRGYRRGWVQHILRMRT